MSSRSPLISVIMPCYNHEEFVEDAINSILSQTLEDFELIIVDDCSKDATSKRVRSIRDSRILFIGRKERGGPSVAFNEAAARATGQYLAMFAGDDISLPSRLRVEHQILEQGYGDAIFAIPEVIDSVGEFDQLQHRRFRRIFQTLSKNEDALEKLFFEGNFLCAPSCMMKMEVWRKLGGLHPGLVQLQDFHAWIRLARFAHIAVLDSPLVQYRVRDDGGNLSAASRDAAVLNEMQYIYRNFFAGMDRTAIVQHFKSQAGTELSKRSQLPLNLEINFLMLAHKHPAVQIIGLHGLLDAIANPELAKLLKKEKNLGPLDVYKLTDSIDAFGIKQFSKIQQQLTKNHVLEARSHEATS